MEQPVSVILPTHNRRHTITRAIDSVLRQTWPELRLIIVDDGSDDGTADLPILRRPPANVAGIVLEYQSGVSHARNIGVLAAQTNIIAFIDSDDEWHPSKVEKQMHWLRGNPAYRIVQSREIWIRNGVRVNPPATHEKTGGDIFAQSLRRCMVTPSSVMLEKSLFLEAGGFNESLPACEDYDLWLKISCRWPVGLVDEHLLTRYGGHADQLSSTVPALDRFRIRGLLDLLRSGALNAGQQELARNELRTKAAIVANGYKKRGNQVLYERYNHIARS